MPRPRAGVTLIEMLIVVALVGLLAGITFPAVSSGIDSLRLAQASDSIVTFLNTALNRAERREQTVEIVVTRADRTLTAQSVEPGFSRTLTLPDGVSIERVLPELPGEQPPVRRFFLYPGGAVPRIGLEISNVRRAIRTVRIDPISGIAQLEKHP